MGLTNLTFENDGAGDQSVVAKRPLEGWDPAYSLLAAAALLLVSLVLAGPLSIDFTGGLNLSPAPVTSSSYKLLYTSKLNDGPVSICVEFNIDRVRAPEFLKLMRDVRLI